MSDAGGDLTAAALAAEAAGAEAFVDDDLAAARAHLERAFALWRDANEPRRAALVAATLADLHHSGFGNRAAGSGWIARARRVLGPVGRCVEAGHVALALVACDAGDAARLLDTADEALALAQEFGDRDLEVRALADAGYALVVLGRSEEGFARLDEAMAALSAGEVRGVAAAGKSFCALLSACDRAGDVRRAEEWTRVLSESVLAATGGKPRVLATHCRLAYGSVLCTVGRWDEGESAILDVLGPTGSVYRRHRADAAARLASLRLLHGRFEEAAALLEPYVDDQPAAAEVQARLHALDGDPALGRAVARRALDDAATAGDRLRLGSLHGLLVEVAIALDDVAGAAAHVDALDALASSSDSRPLRAEARLAAARVHAAAADVTAAIASYEAARDALVDDARPLVRATISLELAGVLAAAGRTADAVVEARAARSAFDALGAKLLADRSDALLRSLGAPARVAARRPSEAVGGLTAREREVLELLRAGLTNAEIGARLFISAKTAEHHVGRVLAKLGVRSRAEAAAVAVAAATTAPEPAK